MLKGRVFELSLKHLLGIDINRPAHPIRLGEGFNGRKPFAQKLVEYFFFCAGYQQLRPVATRTTLHG
jgi:hypothetical protein